MATGKISNNLKMSEKDRALKTMFGVVSLKSLFMHFDICLRLRSLPLFKNPLDYYMLAGRPGT
jgi:hypothetical protein